VNPNSILSPTKLQGVCKDATSMSRARHDACDHAYGSAPIAIKRVTFDFIEVTANAMVGTVEYSVVVFQEGS
jgi:hypothetical protein